MVCCLRVRDRRFLTAAEGVLGIDAKHLKLVTNIPLAESALAAPLASFGEHDFYPHPIQRAAILAYRVSRNHALPDGNKRVALVLLDIYLGRVGYRLTASQTDIYRTFLAVAAGEVDEDYFTIWLDSRTQRVPS
jgi:death-on-curing protein